MADINCKEYNREKKSYVSRRSKRAVIFSCRYSDNSVGDQAHVYHKSLTWVNSSASQRAMSSEASGYFLLVVMTEFAWSVTHA